MLAVRTTLAGSVTVFFLSDIAEAINPTAVRGLIGPTGAARLTPKPTTPSDVQYQQPPITIEGSTVGMADIGGFHVRFKTFDYGVVSVALSRPTAGNWDQFLADGLDWQEDASLSAAAERLCRALIQRLGLALRRPREEFLAEDYVVFALTRLEDGSTAESLIEAHGDAIAQLLRGEREPLSAQEREEVLRHRISYLANNLAVPTWSTAFVYDTESGAPAASKFSNSPTRSCSSFGTMMGSWTPSSSGSTRSCSIPGGFTAGSATDTPAPRVRCTRCSSTSTN
jgi:hypothetical protein